MNQREMGREGHGPQPFSWMASWSRMVFLVAVNRDHQREADRGLGRGDRDGKNTNITPVSSGIRVGAVAPEGDEIEVRGIQHQFDAEQDEDGVACATRRADQADAEQGRWKTAGRGEGLMEDGVHELVSGPPGPGPIRGRIARRSRPRRARRAVRSTPTTSSARGVMGPDMSSSPIAFHRERGAGGPGGGGVATARLGSRPMSTHEHAAPPGEGDRGQPRARPDLRPGISTNSTRRVGVA
jgi:hypothetical protein